MVKNKIQETAIVTLLDMVKVNIPYSKEILLKLNPKKIVYSNKSYLVESRYKTSQKILDKYKFKQIIELGSGFSPHYLNLKNIKNYIEVDFPSNSKKKSNIIKSIKQKSNYTILSGNLLKDSTWKKINNILLSEKTALFSEGFMQYLSKEERKFVFLKIHYILKKLDGIFFFDDSPKYHKDNLILNNLSTKMRTISKNNEISSYISQEDLTKEILSYGFKIKRFSVVKRLVSNELDKSGKIVMNKYKFWILSV